MSESIDWNNPEAVETLLEAEGLSAIDKSIEESQEVHTGVGRQAMTVAGVEQDLVDLEEDMEEPDIDLDKLLDENAEKDA